MWGFSLSYQYPATLNPFIEGLIRYGNRLDEE